MKLKSSIHQLLLGVLFAGFGVLSSCDNLYEDLPECRLYVQFKYDYNMLSADAFHTKVDKVDLYVFDKDGKFLFKQSEEGTPLTTGNYRMEVEVPVGEYKFMAWCGVHNSYDITSLTPGTTTIEEVRLKLKRGESLVIDDELEPLFYGEIIDVNFTGEEHLTKTINLIKDTNKIRFAFQGQTPAWQANVDDYTYEVIESNGYLDYDNSLLPDNPLSYRPYYMAQNDPSAFVVELNTMRLMASRQTRFIVTEKATGDKIFDINLTNFFIMMRMEEHSNWTNQEYLDREDEYKVVFFLSVSPEPSDNLWLAARIDINDWTHYIQYENGI